MDVHVFPIPIPAPTSLSTRSLWVFLVLLSKSLQAINAGEGVEKREPSFYNFEIFTYLVA